MQFTIDHLGREGDGLAVVAGERVAVPFALPGETVGVALARQGSHLHGKLEQVVEASAARVTPPCPHFAAAPLACGNCRLQHMEGAAYHAWKQGLIESALARQGIIKAVDSFFITPPASRRRTRFVAERRKGKLAFGYHARASHAIVPIDSCLVLSPPLQALIRPLQEMVLKLLAEQQRLAIHATALNGVVGLVFSGIAFSPAQRVALTRWGKAQGIGQIAVQESETGPASLLLNPTPLQALYGGHTVTLPPAPFLQASDAVEAAMQETVADYAGESAAVADLFCGSGLFGLSLYKPGRRIMAADCDAPAIAALKVAARHLPDFQVYCRNLFTSPFSAAELKPFTTVLLDPPRAGAASQIHELGKGEAGQIIYVSCDALTFARDAKSLGENGYHFHALHGFDPFLYSHHVEMIGVFRR